LFLLDFEIKKNSFKLSL